MNLLLDRCIAGLVIRGFVTTICEECRLSIRSRRRRNLFITSFLTCARFGVGLHRMAEEVMEEHLEHFERLIMRSSFQAMDARQPTWLDAVPSKAG